MALLLFTNTYKTFKTNRHLRRNEKKIAMLLIGIIFKPTGCSTGYQRTVYNFGTVLHRRSAVIN